MNTPEDMSNIILPLGVLREKDKGRAGGKAIALAAMARNNITVPDGVSITVDAYHLFFSANGLRERVLMELNRKPFSEMRWEEMWDAALRIRNILLAYRG